MYRQCVHLPCLRQPCYLPFATHPPLPDLRTRAHITLRHPFAPGSEHGESKLTMKQNLLYVMHLAHLYAFMYPTALTLALLATLSIVCLAIYAAVALLR